MSLLCDCQSVRALKDCAYLLHKLFFFYLVVKLFTLPAVFCLVNKDLQNHYAVTIVIEGAEISWRGSVYVSSRSAGEQPARSEEEQVHQH